MKNKIILFGLLAIGCIWSSCREQDIMSIIETDETIPPALKAVNAKGLPGKIELSYTVPANSNIMYVEAECTKNDGKRIQAQSSYYNNKLLLDGFGDTSIYSIKLYTVGKNLKKSTPIMVDARPAMPPIWKIYESMSIVEDFGGITINFENPQKAEVSIPIQRKNVKGDWETVETIYTQAGEGPLSVRGLENVPMQFRVSVQDRWLNQSNLIDTILTPLFERELDYALFKELRLVNDPKPFGANKVSFLWNNNLTSTGSGTGGWYRTDNGTGVPNQVTIDMGKKAKLSRIKVFQRGTVSELNLLYTAGSPREFEIWGSNSPSADGSYDSWTLLYSGEIKKPSGLPLQNNTAEDIEFAKNGHEFRIPLEAPPVRYFRFRAMSTFGVTNYFWLGEIDFFGQPE
ncbi:DUF5000 domain-containing lipoprotein [Sphingobacterium faecale]|uniref:DUF5126 domain-containing protein n=1 Tax=Sphingobacterium faecale TaxID=2803775 RepID=A0ABS1R6R1_9SPHI|nr:DUF5000 domain-containing lipoprotein [Sphingobacterium faecale]MBL1410389.1 DUF5126 domain-containing protein [Sphingobacterium faecale]